MSSFKALVLAGDGLNCEQETAQALTLAGFQPEIRHLNDLIAEGFNQDRLLLNYSVFAIPGGFSFGDDIASGRVLALKIQRRLSLSLSHYAEKGGLVIGICNGFQALIRMGVFGKEISITHNENGKFMNAWVRVLPQGAKCVWIKGLGALDLPIRHGEGRIVISKNHRLEVLNRFKTHSLDCLKYENSPNGSEERIAGLCDVTGRIFGLMPHPEAFVRYTQHPEWTLFPDRAPAPGSGLLVFQNAFNEVKNNGGNLV